MSRVPQGSVLCPVLFLVYINDLTNNLESSVSLFADEAEIYSTIKTEENVDNLFRDMVRLEEWSDQWLLTFNTKKGKTMHIRHGSQQANYQLRRAYSITFHKKKTLES